MMKSGSTSGRNAAAATATASDNFERASLGGNWSTPSGVNAGQILNSSVWSGTTDAADNISYWSATAFGTSQYSKATIGDGGDSDAGLVLHMQADSAGYFCDFYQGNWHIFRRTAAGVLTDIGAYSASNPATGTVIELRINGNNVEFYLDSTLRINVSDTTYRSGQPGLYNYYNATNRITIGSWEGGNA